MVGVEGTVIGQPIDSLKNDNLYPSDWQIIKRIIDGFGLESRKLPLPYISSSEYEYASPIGELERKQLVDEMLSLPTEDGRRLFQRSANLRYISKNAASHRALERMYTGPLEYKEATKEAFVWARLFIENIHNSMAIRNRLRLVQEEFKSYAKRSSSNAENALNVLSVAAGSSRGLMMALSSLWGEGYNHVNLKMVDRSRNAQLDGEKLASYLGIGKSVSFLREDVRYHDRYLPKDYTPHFIEVVGLLDYLNENEVTIMLDAFYKHLTEGGLLLFSNVAPNDEEDFTHQIVNWPKMFYRTHEDLLSLAVAVGIDNSKMRLIHEPLHVYNIVVAVK